ncbi:MAG: type VI secretion system tip protein VgrG [Myxococcales bacterium]|nr:type VI secretion system tip protein VgrG [Myxococcales bacterium]
MARYSFSSSAIPFETNVLGFEVEGRLSQPFRADVYFTLQGLGELDLDDPLLASATLTIDETGGAPEIVEGILGELALLRQGEGIALYRATIRPKLWQLGFVRTSRIFTNRTLEEIATDLFAEVGMDAFRFEVASVPVEEHVCQYEESSLDFFHRWAARLGWYYFFDFSDGSGSLVITDNAASHPSVLTAPVPYRPGDGTDTSAGAHFYRVRNQTALAPANVRVRDYDYGRPSVALSKTEAASTSGLGERSDYGVRAFDAGMVARVARVRAEALRAGVNVATVEGFAHHVAPGYRVEISQHPRGALNVAHLVVASTRVGRSPGDLGAWGALLPRTITSTPQSYRVEARIQPIDVPFRAAEETPWPRIDGFENATIDGPGPSPYAQIDDDGRYLVLFHFDEGARKAGKSSTRVRMLQPHGGGTEGWHMPLRKGTEVVCGFLDGDPDRPVIIGALPNAVTPSNVASSNAPQNVLRTGSASYLTIDDTAGAEWANLFTPQKKAGLYLGQGRAEGGRAYTSNAAPPVPPEGPGAMKLGPFSADLRTDDGSGRVHTGGDLNVHAFGKLQEIVKGKTNQSFLSTYDFDNVGPAVEDFHDTQWHHVVGSTKIDHFSEYDLNVSLLTKKVYESDTNYRVQMAAEYKHKAGMKIEVQGDVTDCFCAGAERIVRDPSKLEIKGNYTRTITGGQTYDVKGTRTVKVKGNYNLTVNGNWLGTLKPENFVTDSTEIKVCLGPNIGLVNGTKDETMNGLHLEVWAGMHMELTLGVNKKDNLALNFGLTGKYVGLVGINLTACPVLLDLIPGGELDKIVAEVDFTYVRISVGGALIKPNGVTSQ